MTTAHRMSISTVAFLIGLGSSPVLAQTVNDNTSTASTVAVTAPNTANSNNSFTPTEVGIDRIIDRDLSDQKRIEAGLKDGDITSGEDARLERDESRIDRMLSKDLSDGTLSPQEAARIRRAQIAEGNQITRFDDNGNKVTAGTVDPRLVSDTQRDIRLDQRIDRGLDNSNLNNSNLTAAEVARLEGAQAAEDRGEFRFDRNGDHDRDGNRDRDDKNKVSFDNDRDGKTLGNDRDRDDRTKLSVRDINGPDGDHDRDDRTKVSLGDRDRDGDHDRDDRTKVSFRDINGPDGDRDRDGGTKVSFRDDINNINNGHDGDHDRDDMRRSINQHDRDDHGDKGRGHWSWDRPHHGLDRDDLKTNVSGNLTASDNGNVSTGSPTSTSVDASGTASTPVNAGSSASITAPVSADTSASTAASNVGSAAVSTPTVTTPSSVTAPPAMTPVAPVTPPAPVMAPPAVTPVHATPVVTPHVAPPHAVVVPHK